MTLESLIQDLSETVITGFTDLSHDLRLTPYFKRPKKTTIETPSIPTAAAGPRVDTPDSILQTTRSTAEEAAQL